MRLIVIDYSTSEGVDKQEFMAAEDLPTLEQAQAFLSNGEDTDFTDQVTYVWELGVVWTTDGKRYEVGLKEADVK